jgi:uncharacterized Zn finger protein (UPF0148 family)
MRVRCGWCRKLFDRVHNGQTLCSPICESAVAQAQIDRKRLAEHYRKPEIRESIIRARKEAALDRWLAEIEKKSRP